jgi:hypothetical protein
MAVTKYNIPSLGNGLFGNNDVVVHISTDGFVMAHIVGYIYYPALVSTGLSSQKERIKMRDQSDLLVHVTQGTDREGKKPTREHNGTEGGEVYVVRKDLENKPGGGGKVTSSSVRVKRPEWKSTGKKVTVSQKGADGKMHKVSRTTYKNLSKPGEVRIARIGTDRKRAYVKFTQAK